MEARGRGRRLRPEERPGVSKLQMPLQGRELFPETIASSLCLSSHRILPEMAGALKNFRMSESDGALERESPTASFVGVIVLLIEILMIQNDFQKLK